MATAAYLQKAWGDFLEDPTIHDVRNAISEIIQMDDEHGAFWISIGNEEETVLETHKDLLIIGIFPGTPEQQIKSSFKNWKEIEDLYKIFLTEDFDKVKAMLITAR